MSIYFFTENDHVHAFYAPTKNIQIGWWHHVIFCVWKNRSLFLANGVYKRNLFVRDIRKLDTCGRVNTTGVLLLVCGPDLQYKTPSRVRIFNVRGWSRKWSYADVIWKKSVKHWHVKSQASIVNETSGWDIRNRWSYRAGFGNNSMYPKDTRMRPWTASSLVLVMAWRLFGAKPLPAPLPIYCLLYRKEQPSVKF